MSASPIAAAVQIVEIDDIAARRAGVERLLDAMAAENADRANWFRAPIPNDGKIVLGSITGKKTTIALPTRRRAG